MVIAFITYRWPKIHIWDLRFFIHLKMVCLLNYFIAVFIPNVKYRFRPNNPEQRLKKSKKGSTQEIIFCEEWMDTKWPSTACEFFQKEKRNLTACEFFQTENSDSAFQFLENSALSCFSLRINQPFERKGHDVIKLCKSVVMLLFLQYLDFHCLPNNK